MLKNTKERLFEQDKNRKFPFMARAFGIKQYSLLKDVQNFNMTQSMIVDFMHDVGECCIPRTLTIFLNVCIDLRIITIDEINERLVSFDYGFKQAKIKLKEINLNQESSMGLSGSEKLVLTQHFPFIFPGLVSNARLRRHWRTFSNPIAIAKISLLREINERDLELLETHFKSYLIWVFE